METANQETRKIKVGDLTCPTSRFRQQSSTENTLPWGHTRFISFGHCLSHEINTFSCLICMTSTVVTLKICTDLHRCTTVSKSSRISPTPRWSRRRKGPPRNGGKPMPNTAPMSPSTGEAMIPSCRHKTASLTNLLRAASIVKMLVRKKFDTLQDIVSFFVSLAVHLEPINVKLEVKSFRSSHTSWSSDISF